MKPSAIPTEKVSEQAGEPDPGYAAWERAKIELGLAQSQDRLAILPVPLIWRDILR